MGRMQSNPGRPRNKREAYIVALMVPGHVFLVWLGIEVLLMEEWYIYLTTLCSAGALGLHVIARWEADEPTKEGA